MKKYHYINQQIGLPEEAVLLARWTGKADPRQQHEQTEEMWRLPNGSFMKVIWALYKETGSEVAHRKRVVSNDVARKWFMDKGKKEDTMLTDKTIEDAETELENIKKQRDTALEAKAKLEVDIEDVKAERDAYKKDLLDKGGSLPEVPKKPRG